VSETPQLLSTKPVRRWGNSYVVTLSQEVRKALGIKLGDRVAFRKLGRYVVMGVERACQVIPVSSEEKRQAHEAIGD
jgi:antitoxin component of MazEF toxin-antitoxin module